MPGRGGALCRPRPGARAWGTAIPAATRCRGLPLVAKLWLRDASVEALLRVQCAQLGRVMASPSPPAAREDARVLSVLRPADSGSRASALGSRSGSFATRCRGSTRCRGLSLVAKLWLRDASVEALLRVQPALLGADHVVAVAAGDMGGRSCHGRAPSGQLGKQSFHAWVAKLELRDQVPRGPRRSAPALARATAYESWFRS